MQSHPRKLLKMSATGNDFLLVDARQNSSLQPSSRAQWAKQICDRHFGVGADGLIFVESSRLANLKWDFYNSDGSQAEMCGNAARCMVVWAKLHGLPTSPLRWESATGIREGSFLSHQQIQIDLPVASPPGPEERWQSHTHELNYRRVNSGVPHAVISPPPGLNRSTLLELARGIRNAETFRPAGTNVTFILQSSGRDEIEILTYERGVEDFTLSCGTGAVAAALVHQLKTGAQLIKVKVPGGSLSVDLAGAKPYLIGPAQAIAYIELIES